MLIKLMLTIDVLEKSELWANNDIDINNKTATQNYYHDTMTSAAAIIDEWSLEAEKLLHSQWLPEKKEIQNAATEKNSTDILICDERKLRWI